MSLYRRESVLINRHSSKILEKQSDEENDPKYSDIDVHGFSRLQIHSLHGIIGAH